MLKNISTIFLLLLLGYASLRPVRAVAEPHHMEELPQAPTHSVQKEAASATSSVQYRLMTGILWTALTIFWGGVVQKSYTHFFSKNAKWTSGDILFVVIINLVIGTFWTCLFAILVGKEEALRKFIHSEPVAPTKAVDQRTEKAVEHLIHCQSSEKDPNANDDVSTGSPNTAPAESDNSSTNTTIDNSGSMGEKEPKDDNLATENEIPA